MTFGIPPGVHESLRLYTVKPNYTYLPPSNLTGWNKIDIDNFTDDITITANGEYGGDGSKYFDHISVDVPVIAEGRECSTYVAVNDLTEFEAEDGLPQFLYIDVPKLIERLASGDVGYTIYYSDLLRGMADSNLDFNIIYREKSDCKGVMSTYIGVYDDLDAQEELLNYCQMKGWLET